MDALKQKSLGAAFLARHTSPQADHPIIVLPNAWDVASALLLARAGFKAIATTSAGVGYTGGYPVGEVMPLDEMLGDVKRWRTGSPQRWTWRCPPIWNRAMASRPSRSPIR
jgi:2-methylisocitrate lyase-like PEP mutase family enzyme